MSWNSFFGGNSRLIGVLSVLFAAVYYRQEFKALYETFREVAVDFKAMEDGVFSNRQLSLYNGIDKKKLYLALMGSIFDVTKGKTHYGKGASYHYFVGKDGSRAFVTGNFQDESENRDHILNLSCDELFSLLTWINTFKQKYKEVGVLSGRYYDKNGQPTVYSKQLDVKLKLCRTDKEKAMREEQKFPPCNMEWSEEHGSRVWCTKSSGGVTRSWAGVPRQLFTPGEDKPRCVCINPHKNTSGALFKEYKNCKPDSDSCNIDS